MPYLRILLNSLRCPMRVERSSRVSRCAPRGTWLLEREPADVERRRPELGAELVERGDRVRGEHVFHHPDLAVVVERDVDVRRRDEVERQPTAARTAHGETNRPVGRGEQCEGGRKHGPRLLLRVAEEAPGPLAP